MGPWAVLGLLTNDSKDAVWRLSRTLTPGALECHVVPLACDPVRLNKYCPSQEC